MAGDVVFEDGVRGEVWPELLAAGDDGGKTRVRLTDGRQVLVPAALMAPRPDGTWAVLLRAADLPTGEAGSLPDVSPPLTTVSPLDGAVPPGEGFVVPVVEEALDVGKRLVETGRVRVTKSVIEREEVVDEPLTRTEAEVVRVPMGRIVDAVPPERWEGDTLVIPVVEEVLVVEKRLMLVEEVRVTQRRSEHRAPQTVTSDRGQADFRPLRDTRLGSRCGRKTGGDRFSIGTSAGL